MFLILNSWTGEVRDSKEGGDRASSALESSILFSRLRNKIDQAYLGFSARSLSFPAIPYNIYLLSCGCYAPHPGYPSVPLQVPEQCITLLSVTHEQ